MPGGLRIRKNRKRTVEEQSPLPLVKNEHSPEEFQIKNVLGRGSFGTVFQVRKITDSHENQLYAMKVMHKSRILSSPDHIKHLMNERNVLVSTDSPFLCKMFFAFQTDAKLYIVMEYVGGGNLFGYITRVNGLSESDSKFYIAEILLGLEYLHGHDIIYRDLKPDNIMIDRFGHLKLTDLGLAKEHVNEKNKTYTFCGTPEYMAPEIFKRNGYQKEVDVWSLGIVLFEMLYNSYPFEGRTLIEIADKVQYMDVPLCTHFSSQVQDLIQKMLTREIKERITIDGIKEHIFLQTIDWNKVAALEILPPFVPKLSNEEDVSLFSDEFTDMIPIDSPTKPLSKPLDIDVFSGFSYSGEIHRVANVSDETSKSKQENE